MTATLQPVKFAVLADTHTSSFFNKRESYLSVLAAGEPARRLRTRGDFVFIRTLDGTAWIARDQFGLVCPQ